MCDDASSCAAFLSYSTASRQANRIHDFSAVRDTFAKRTFTQEFSDDHAV